MKIKDVKDVLNAKIICGEEFLNKDIYYACGADMMSEVLAFLKDRAVLLTGLCNSQVIRTAEMMDVTCIVFVRGKMPDDAMIALANQKNIVLMKTNHLMFSACGLLYESGLRGGSTYE